MNAQVKRWGFKAPKFGQEAVFALIASIPLMTIPVTAPQAAIEGTPMSISVDADSVMLADDQQNPYILEVSDKGLWFVIWEDWRNWRTTGADIYGRFIRSDGSFCGSEIEIAANAVHETVPVAAYRDVLGDSGDKIVVVWQDGRGSSTEGYVRFKDISLGATVDCSSLAGVTLGGENVVGYNQTHFNDGTSRNDQLRSRQKPKVSYDSVADVFRMAWVESRSLQQHYSENCFGLLPVSEHLGDEDYLGYVGVNADTLAEIVNEIGVVGADIMRNGSDRSLRRISASGGGGGFEERYVYEFFTDLNNVAVSNDIAMSETLYAWEGASWSYELTCSCNDENNSNACDAGDTFSFTTESGPTDDGLTHIHSLPLGLIHLGSIWSERVDISSSSPSFQPSIGLDPVHRKFLVAWEDTRDGTNTKVYGQLLHSGGGHYDSNFVISYSDSDQNGEQDPNVAGSRQTRPSVGYDASHQRFFVTWQDGRNTRTSLENLDIYGQFIDSEGSLRGENLPISVAPGNQYNPVTAYNRDSHHFLTVWKDSSNAVTDSTVSGVDYSFSDIKGQRFTLGQPQLNLVNIDDTSLVPPLFDYGLRTVGQSATHTVKLVNDGDTYVNVDCVNPYVPTPTADMPFSYAFTVPEVLQTCGDGLTLELVPSSEYLLGIEFTPSVAGTFISHFTIESDAGSPTIFLQGISLAAEDVANEASIVTFPNGSVDCGTVGSAETRSVNLNFENTGNTDATVVAMDVASGSDSPFSVIDLSVGTVIPADSTVYAIIQCDGSSVDDPGEFSSNLRLLFDNEQVPVELTLNAVVVAEPIAGAGSSSSADVVPGASQWQVIDTWEGNDVVQPDSLQISVDGSGDVTGTWGAYQFPITYVDGVGWTWSFTNETYTWYYTITSVENDVASGTWRFQSASSTSEEFATRAIMQR